VYTAAVVDIHPNLKGSHRMQLMLKKTEKTNAGVQP
jgi:hypothetical protein